MVHIPNPEQDFNAPAARRIIDIHVWAVREGLRGTEPTALFADLCRRLVDSGVPVWRAFAGAPTLHPQWAGYSYTWWRDGGGIEPAQFPRGDRYEQIVTDSVFGYLLRKSAAMGNRDPWISLRRRLAGPEARTDLPVLAELAADGATDYFAELVHPGFEEGPRSGGVGYSFTTDQTEGFSDNDITTLGAVLPVVALAMKAYAGHAIAAGLLSAYLGHNAGRRVHQGAVERGSVETISAVLWNADIRGFTRIADEMPGAAVIELLDEVFETLAASLRRRGAEILKFMGDGMLAIFPISDVQSTCRQAFDAAAEAMGEIDRMNGIRSAAGKRVATVDLALHLGEVSYGNIGAADRLDFTVIGPAVNEVARIEALCEPLGRNVLVSAELAAAGGYDRRLVPLGRYSLRGVREARVIYGLEYSLPGTDPRPRGP
jgi:adenylate cyclase